MQLLLIGFLCFCSVLFGAETTISPPVDPFADRFPLEEPPKTLTDTNFLGEFLYMLLMLGILISVVFFISWFLKRMMNTKIEQQNATSSIHILERRALSNRTTLFLIEMENKTMLIAETPTGVVSLFTEESKE